VEAGRVEGGAGREMEEGRGGGGGGGGGGSGGKMRQKEKGEPGRRTRILLQPRK